MLTIRYYKSEYYFHFANYYLELFKYSLLRNDITLCIGYLKVQKVCIQ